VFWAVLLIGLFYVMIMIIGVGARAILGSGAEEASAGGNLAIRCSSRSSAAARARSAATSSWPS
jgi:Na+(H+)/acetate symporter ActP